MRAVGQVIPIKKLWMAGVDQSHLVILLQAARFIIENQRGNPSPCMHGLFAGEFLEANAFIILHKHDPLVFRVSNLFVPNGGSTFFLVIGIPLDTCIELSWACLWSSNRNVSKPPVPIRYFIMVQKLHIG